MLTLITATLNAECHIERAFASVPQTVGEIHHLVVDGGSSDTTLSLCRKFPCVETVVVPGCTIYEAWNIGIERGRGDHVVFLNADDELAEGALETIATEFARHPAADIVAGQALMFEHDASATAPRVLKAAPSGLLAVEQLALGVPAINAMAFRRSVFERWGRFDTIFRLAGDRAFLLRLALSPSPPLVVNADALLYHYHSHPGSLTLKRSLQQRVGIARDHIALADTLLAQRPTAAVGRVLRYWRRREAAVAALRCAAAGRLFAFFGFGCRLFASRRAL